MDSYDTIRQQYKPAHIKLLLIAESQPPSADKDSSRHFYRTDKPRRGDRLFSNTIKAAYTEAAETSEAELEETKQQWLKRLQSDGWYMIEALETSLPHRTTKKERQELIRQNLPNLIERVKQLAKPNTKIVLIKSNVFEVAAAPLRNAGFTVLNKELLDYPGQYNQKAYREKLTKLLANI